MFYHFGYPALLYILVQILRSLNAQDDSFHQHIPFFIMQPHTIINQTLHSYCKEQMEFNSRPMFVNLTEWPSGFIYARNPHQNFEDDYDTKSLLMQECTMELRASIGDRIRMIFYPIVDDRDEVELDYDLPIARRACLKIRDKDETVTIDCPILSEKKSFRTLNIYSEDHLSNSNVIYLELILPSIIQSRFEHWYYHQFKLFFTTFTPKLHVGANQELFLCPVDHLIDCDDAFCVHNNARCNGIYDCRTKIDEESCRNQLFNGCLTHSPRYSVIIKLVYLLIWLIFIRRSSC